MPGALTRREVFDRVVARAVIHLAQHTPDIAEADVVVEDVPLASRRLTRAPLGRIMSQLNPPQLVLHRRPIEQAGGGTPLVRDVLAELVGEWLAHDPGDVDPHYPRW